MHMAAVRIAVANKDRPTLIKAVAGWYWVRRIAKYERGFLTPNPSHNTWIPAMFSDNGMFHYLDLCSIAGMPPDEFELGPRIEAPTGMTYDGKGYMRAIYAK